MSLIFVWVFSPWNGFCEKFLVSIWKVWSLLLNQDCVDTEIQKIELSDIFSKDFLICSGLSRENIKQIIHDFAHLSNNLEDLLKNPLQILSGFNLRGEGEFHFRVVQCKMSWFPHVFSSLQHQRVPLDIFTFKSWRECKLLLNTLTDKGISWIHWMTKQA